MPRFGSMRKSNPDEHRPGQAFKLEGLHSRPIFFLHESSNTQKQKLGFVLPTYMSMELY